MTSIVAAYARQRLADMEELTRDLGAQRARRAGHSLRWSAVRREVWSAVQSVLP